MLKDLGGNPEQELAAPCGDAQDSLPPQADEQTCARFRMSLWLGIAAEIRRRRVPQKMKELVSC